MAQLPEETREKLRQGGRMSAALEQDEAVKQRIGDRVRKQWAEPEYLRKMQEIHKQLWQDSEYRAKIIPAFTLAPKPPKTDEHRKSLSIAGKTLWRDPTYKQSQIEAILKGLWKRPTRPEQFLIDFFQSHNLPFRYVGDGEFILGGLCPDFLNTNGRKQLIELFGQYWHDVSDVAIRTKHFAQYGFLLLVIWEDKLEDEARLLRKVKTFAGRKE